MTSKTSVKSSQIYKRTLTLGVNFHKYFKPKCVNTLWTPIKYSKIPEAGKHLVKVFLVAFLALNEHLNIPESRISNFYFKKSPCVELECSTISGRSVSVTDASGKPYVPTASNGSMASMNTTSTTIGSTNGSTVGSSSVTRSPLRSSLKKPKPKDGLGIQNPGFSGTSPTLSRNGSTKKVRIQTHSTEV